MLRLVSSVLSAISDEWETWRTCLTMEIRCPTKPNPLLQKRGCSIELFAMPGVPKHIRSDNGDEFIAQPLSCWLKLVGVGKLALKPREPSASAPAAHAVCRKDTRS